MDILNQVIAGMNKEDIWHFKLYTTRIESASERKDLNLFDYIRKSGDAYKEAKIVKILYKGKDKNSFYRLKNRLTEDINKCLALQHYNSDDIIYLFHILSLIRLHYKRNHFKLALYFAKKAETKAKQTENYELIDIIYGEFIKLSHEIISMNPEEYIIKRKENRVVLNSLREIDDILAAVNYRLKITQNFSENETPILKMLQKTIDDFSQNPLIKKSAKLRFRIYSAVSQVLIQKREYKTLEQYLLKTYSHFKKANLFDRNNHDTKLQMLTYIVNTLFKNKRLQLSLVYAEQLGKAINEYDQLFYDKYAFFYYNSLVINYSVLDKDKAISILEDLKEKKFIKENSFHEIFVYLNLAVLWFDKKQFHNSISNLNKLYLHDSYKKADVTFKFKISIAELIIRYELKDLDFLDHKIKQVKKDYKDLLNKEEHIREKQFLNILMKMILTNTIKRDKIITGQIKSFMEGVKKDDLDDKEIIDYKNWLSSKI